MSQQRIELAISGMHCASCDQHVTRALKDVFGVQYVDVPGWRSGRATVTAAADVTPEALVSAVEAVGYGAVVRKRVSLENADVPENARASHDFDVLVIGGGSGGFAAAITASDLNKRVGIINAGTIGGTCVNIGCVPSKTLIRAAESWHNAAHHAFKGLFTGQNRLDWSVVRSEKDALVSSLRQQKYVEVLAAYPNITFIEGVATFEADGSVRVGNRHYTAARYVIATGAHPRMVAIPGSDEAQPLTSTTLMSLDKLPESLIVLGGRAIALELGQMMARLGVNVLILQRSTRLVPEHEPEIGRAIQNYLLDEGIGVITGVQVEYLNREGATRVVHARVMGQPREFRADHLLMALGREPNTAALGLEQVGVQTDANGFILVNEFQQTTNPNIFAVGDVTTNPELVYVAAASGNIAARNALGGEHQALDLSVVPQVIFTDPQIATVGLTEQAAQKQNHEVQVSTVSLEHVPRALAARDTRGFIKLVADTGSGRLLGAHIVAAEAGEVIQTATLAIKFGLTIEDMTSTFFPYLTQVEGLKLAALAFHKDITRLSCCAS
ncbi:MAG: mercury(II) reductase [Anaerolineae bacterium]|nr:mercury(II) reductase [Anaerolineae bacterium]